MTDGTGADERVRRLNSTEIDSYDMVPAELATRVRVVRIPGLPGPYQGLTLGRAVFLTKIVPADGWSRLLAHELVHVRQWTELGVVRFSWSYLRDFVEGLVRTRSWQQAYRQVGLERDARADTDEWQRRRNTRPPGRR